MLVILIILYLELSVAQSRKEWDTNHKKVDILCSSQVRTVVYLSYVQSVVFSIARTSEVVSIFGCNLLCVTSVDSYLVSNVGPQIQMLLQLCILLWGFLLPETRFKIRRGASGVQGWCHQKGLSFQNLRPQRLTSWNHSLLQDAVLLKDQTIR